MRNADDIDNTIKLCLKSTAVYATTVSKLEINPYCILKKKQNKFKPIFDKIKRRSKEEFYIINGAVYVLKKDVLNLKCNFNTVYHEMPIDRSIDIDNIKDFNYAKILLNIRK